MCCRVLAAEIAVQVGAKGFAASREALGARAVTAEISKILDCVHRGFAASS